jgi:autotransporter-associated beta strand protein
MKPRLLSAARLSLPLAMALAALLAATSAKAVNLWWDINGATATPAVAGTGTWTAGSAANWTTVLAGNLATAEVTTTNADDLTFSSTGMSAGTITVSGTQLARTITFNTATTLSGGVAIDLGNATAGSGLFHGNVVNTINTPIILNSAATAIGITIIGNQTQTFNATATISGAATSGSQTLTVSTMGAAVNLGGVIGDGGAGGTVSLAVNANGLGVTTLSAANTYTGATRVIAGTLQISNAGTFTSTSGINLFSTGRLTVNVADQSLAKLASGGGVVAGSFLRYSQPQTAGGTGPGTIFGTVELNNAGVNPDYTLDLGSGSMLTNLVASTYTSALTLSGNASIDASAQVATYTTGGITASTAGTKTLTLTGSNTGSNTISSDIANGGSGTLAITKGGAGTWILGGTNTYTGNTLVSGGTLLFINPVSLYNDGAAAPWTNANINVSTGATLALGVGGVGEFEKADITSLLGLSTSPTNGFNSGSRLGLDTTGGEFLYDSVIADTNGGANVLGLAKLGSNTLILDKNNTYTGRTVISGGTLQLGNGGATGALSADSVIQNNGDLTINRNNAVTQGTDFSGAPIIGTGSFTQAGTGTTTLSAPNTFTGTTTVSAGVLRLTNERALQNSALVTTGAGTVILSGFTTPILGGLSGPVDLSSVIPGFNGSSVTLNPQTGSTFTYGGVIPDGVPGMTLTKNGGGTQVLNSAAVHAFTGGLILNGGTILGDFANLAPPTDLFNPANVLTLGGGTLSLTAKFDVTSSQTFASTVLTAGTSSKITLTSSGAGTMTLDLKAINRGAGSILNFTAIPDTTSRFALTTKANTNDILGTWATVGATTTLQYAANNGSGQIVGLGATGTTAATAATAGTLANVTSDTTNYTYAAAATVGASLTGNTLRYTGAATTTALGTNGLTLNGLMHAGTGALTITGTAANPGLVIGSSGELDIVSNAQTLNINSVISGTGTVVFNSAGTINLGVTNFFNTYVGSTVINGGSVGFAAAATPTTFFGTGPVTVNSGATVALNRTTLPNPITLNGATVTAGNSFTSLLSGPLTLGGISTINVTGNLTISGDIDGTGGLIKLGGATVPVTGVNNSYTGTTTILGGALRFKSSLYSNNEALWTPANITVGSGAALVLNVGGGGEFTIEQVDTLFSSLATGVNNNGLLAGSLRGVDTSGGGAGSISEYASVLADSTGPGGGPVGIKHFGVGTLLLSGNNTYTGQTITDNNGILSVSSLNSVFTNPSLGTVHSASSSLGAPTTVANGTILLGQTTFQGGGLKYTGTGETTDRVVNLGGANGTTYTFDQSGTGLLKFISPFTLTDNRGAKTIVLQGSTDGTGEIASVILNGDVANPNRLTKSGTGIWTLSGANLYRGVTTVSGGVLMLAHPNALNGGIGATGGLGNLTFNGGVIGLPLGDFTRPLNTAATAGATTFTGAGGWAAYGADRLVNLGGASASIPWATANTGFNGRTIILGNATATHMVTLQNPLDLGTAARTVQVDDGAAPIDGTLSGVLSSGTGGGLTKTGAGTLALTAANDYTGGTTVAAGTLVVSATGSIATSSSISLGTTAVLDITSQPLTLPATAAFSLDPVDAGSSGRINAAALDITNAVVTLTATAPLDDAVYILANYSSLTGTRFASVSLLTGPLAGYSINYAYNGGTQIALVPATGYELWAGFNAGGEGFDLDFDRDGIPNGIEYFMGETGSTFTPNPSIVDGKVTWPYDATATGITYRVVSSTGLGTWDPVVPQPVPSGGTLEYTLPTGEPRLFIRLEVSKVP